jgi:hypothetical protein
MSEDLRARARQAAGRAYRGIGKLGRLALGDEPDPAAAAPGSRPVGERVFAEPPWEPLPDAGDVVCNICRWTGRQFLGHQHCESSHCPECGSCGRDRFLHWCFAQRTELHTALRIIECSPRLGPNYRAAMGTWFFYRTSDYDLGAHQGNLQLDLQAIDLPDDSLDVMLCAHVLEHVPDTDKALAELRRVISPNGHLVLQVPVLQSRTAPPTEPEFHEDNTPVFWRFGFDLTARLREHGFDTDLLCTEQFAAAVEAGTNPWNEWSGEFDVPDLVASAIAEDLVVVADRSQSARLGVDPGYMYLTWDCRVLPG